jgi:hypothetical protein
MTAYLLDREPQWAPESRQNWGNLLKAVERRLRLRGRIVTAVRCDGVVRPSFRDRQLREQGLATMGTIEIESATAAGLLADTMTTARDGVGRLETAASRVADSFRRDPVQANCQLAELVEAIRALTVLTGAMAQVISLETEQPLSVAATDITQPVGAALRALRESQAARDWEATAGCLENDLRPAMRAWHTLFDRLDSLREAA